MPTIRIDGTEFDLESRRTLRVSREVREGIPMLVRWVAMQVKRSVQIRMPKDTTRAASSWGNVPAPFPALPFDGVWEVEDDGWSIVQGSNVEYVPALNEGHSSQAPAGFIDAEAVRGRDMLEDEINKFLARML